MFRYIIILFVLVLSATSPVVAVDTLQVHSSDPILEDWRWTVFDKDDGLAGSVIDVYEDGETIWFGTREGVQKYDGLRWTTYTVDDGLVHNHVGSVIRAQDGSMWFGTGGGISRLSVSETGEQHWTTYTFDDGPNAVGLQGLCQARDGTIWAGFIDLTNADSTNTGAIRRFEDGKWSIVVPTAGAPPRPGRPLGWRIPGWGVGGIQAGDGAMLFKTSGGVLRFDGTDWTLTSSGTLTQIIEASDGSIWVTSFSGPAEAIRFDGNSWTHYPASEVGIPNPAGCWQADDGTIWVSGSNRISRFRDGQWFSYPRFEIDRQLGGATRGVSVSGGTTWLWSGGQPAVARFKDDRDVVYFSHPDSLWVGPVGPDGSVWFRTSSGAVRLLDGVWLRYTVEDGFLDGTVEDRFLANGARSLARSRDGSIWAVGTHRGLGAAARFHRGQWKVFTEEDGVIDTPSRMLSMRDGSLWAMGAHDGVSAVSLFNGTSWQRFASEHGFSGAGGVTIAYEASDGTVWFGAHVDGMRGTGLHRFDPSAPAGQGWTRFTEADSLADTHVAGLGEWPEGTLWAGTTYGMHRIELSDLPQNRTWWRKTDFGISRWPKFGSFVPTEEGLWIAPYVRSSGVLYFDGKSWNLLRKDDGLSDDRLRRIFRASDGAVWFLGATGLSRFDSERWTRFTSANGIRSFDAGYFIQNVTEASDGTFWMEVDGKQVLRFRYHEPPVPETDMKPTVEQVSSAGNILVHWSGATKWNQTPAEDMRYRWRLNEGEWTETEQTDVTFTSLTPGAYQFEVYAVAPTMRRDASPAIHAFVVEVPWWRNPHVIGLVLVFVGITGVQASRIVSSNRKLQEANAAMSSANKELFGLNEDLQQKTEDLDRSNQVLQQKTDDLDKSNRELTAEAVLERVRAKALGMQESEDLYEVSASLFEASEDLGFSLFRFGITILDEEADTVEEFPTRKDSEGRQFYVASFREWSESCVLGGGEAMEARKQGHPHVFELAGEGREVFLRSLQSMYKFSDAWLEKALGALPDPAIVHWVFFPHGHLSFVTVVPLTEDDLAVARRFAEVFEFAYTRFQELQEKEERVRDAERQAAVDRVRAEAAGMQKSDEIAQVVVALWTALKDVGILFEWCGIQIINSEAEVLTHYTPQAPGLWSENKMVRENILEGIHLYATDIPLDFARERGYAMPGVEPAVHTMAETFPEDIRQIWFEDTPPGDVPDLSFLVGLDLLNVPFADGGIVIFAPTGHRYTPQDLQTAVEFADGVSLGLTRFLDFQRLEAANKAMSEANKELFSANQALQRDSAVERIRGEVQAMDQASDFERVLSLLSEDLKTVGLSFETCSIEVLDEPMDEPTMAYFEDHGYRYTAYTIDPDGTVASNSYHIPAPFPPVNLETIERFVAGEPWQGRSGDTAIVEVPASNYGRLRMTSSERQDFNEEDIAALQDFASAIALGYARYLDIKEIQEQTQKKSAFLASMSHELRTPMNAIKGFTNLVLRREEDLSDRNRENLEKVTQASDHLLAMINDLLDLSKIEAGRMDVNASAFDVRQLVDYCVSTVSPLVQEGVILSAEIDEEVGEAHTDEARLRQMLINLASNAIKFTKSGRVTVKASIQETGDRRQEAGGSEDGQMLEISVSDTGKGIPEDELATIFDEYRQVEGSDREHRGTGLGLSITKQFAELLGGSIGVESEVGKGSTFTVRVPVMYQEG